MAGWIQVETAPFFRDTLAWDDGTTFSVGVSPIASFRKAGNEVNPDREGHLVAYRRQMGLRFLSRAIDKEKCALSAGEPWPEVVIRVAAEIVREGLRESEEDKASRAPEPRWMIPDEPIDQ